MGKNSAETLKKRNEKKRKQKKIIDPASVPKFIDKKCKDCGEIKPCQWNSSFTQDGVPEYKARCVDCHRTQMNDNRRNSRFKGNKTIWKRNRNRERKKYAIEKLGGKCKICGYNKCSAALTFHHIDPAIKEFPVGVLFGYTKEKLDAELEKCILVCFNCHMEIHYTEEEDGVEKVS